MKSTRITLPHMGVSAAFAALAATSFALSATAQGARIAAVNSKRALRGLQPAKATQAKLETGFVKRDREPQDMAAKLKGMSDKLDKDSAVLADSNRNRRQHELSDLDRDFQRKQHEFREDLNQRRNEELAQMLERVNRVIRSIAEQRKYDLVVQEAVYVNLCVDIADEVLKALNSQSAR